MTLSHVFVDCVTSSESHAMTITHELPDRLTDLRLPMHYPFHIARYNRYHSLDQCLQTIHIYGIVRKFPYISYTLMAL